MTNYSDYFGVYTYLDPLIYFKVESFDNWSHREKAAKKDYFLKKFINGLDISIFEEKPIFIPDILETNKDAPNEPKEEGKSIELNGKDLTPAFSDKNILKEWNDENWTALMVALYDAARTHKWCIPQLYDEPPWWRVFTYREIIEIIYDENDIPIKAHAQWAKNLPRAQMYNLHDEWINLVEADAEELNEEGEVNSLGLFVNWGHDIDTRIDGNDLESVWSLCVYLRYILQDILNNSAKSSGFYWLIWGSGVADPIKDDIQNSFEMCGSSHMIGATEEVIKQMTAMYPANPEFSILAMDKVMKIFSGATNLPYLYFNSEKDTGGVFEENSSAMAQVNDKKREVFGKLKHYILKLVEMRWGVKCEDVFANIAEVEEEQFTEDIIEPRTSTSDSGIELEPKRGGLRS